jgi:tetratricopeptide (TPR) repeat protein
MIVKDEAAHIEACLDSLEPLAHEICVVDTGSSDDTAAIARRRGARVETFTWRDDFGAARNASLDLCTGDWVFIVDADERLDEPGRAAIRALAEGPLDRCYRVMTRNYTNHAGVGQFRPCLPGDPHALGFAGWFPSWKIRLFPNGTGARYEGRVHELIRPSLERHGIVATDCDAVVHHYPMLHGADRIRAKQSMYARLGEAKVRECPDDPKGYIELGTQYAELGECANAVRAFREALRRDPQNAAAWKDLGAILYLMQRVPEAAQSLRLAVQYDSHLVDAWRNLGVIHAGQGQWDQAAECFAHAVAEAPESSEGHRYLSLALDNSGHLSEAAAASRRAIEADPRSVAAAELYAVQTIRLGCAGEARQVLQELVRKHGTTPVIEQVLARLAES